MKTQLVQIHGLKHCIYTWGKASLPKIFFVHGFMDCGANFQFLCEHLEKIFHCIAIDLRGFGRSEATKNPLGYNFFEYIADLNRFFEIFSPKEPVHLVGHSMGGNIGCLYAGAFPERVKTFINLEGFGIPDSLASEGPERMRRWIKFVSAKPKKKRRENLQFFARKILRAHPNLNLAQASFITRQLTRKTTKGYELAADPKHYWPSPRLYHFAQVKTFIEKIEARCLILLGERSPLRSLAAFEKDQRKIEKRLKTFPKSTRRAILKECGHMIHYDQPLAAARLIRDFIEA